MEREVRVRFAPSPTGPLHIGGVRTALYNYLLARKTGGKMILRIEDTDQNRFVPGAEDYIRQSLEWCGIELDESPWNGGPYAPYRQSERKPMYMQYALQLINDGHAYYAFDTAEELDAMRERLKAAKVATPQYNAITRATMRNSLTMPEDEVKKLLESGAPYVIRLKVPRKEEIRLKDMIRGWVMVHSSSIDDKVLMKSDGMPTYHLANIVDDHLMKITHVIRGEEWLPSAPLHVLLYRYLGWEDTMPEFAHLPLLLKPDGNGKLSKRDGDKLGFPVFPLHWQDPFTGEISSGYREAGYLPDAFVNFLAFLGWNPGTQQEIFSMEELANEFTVERIGKSGTRFDIQKARWFNEQYLRAKPDSELAGFLLTALEEHNINCTQEKAEKVAGLMKERVSFPQDFWKEAAYFFVAPEEYNEKVASKKWNAQSVAVFEQFKNELPTIADFNADAVKELLTTILERNGMKIGQVMQALRLAVTGAEAGPDLMQIIEIIGREETISRIETAIAKLSQYTTAE
ncbi:glutamate--tRNA ligase [Pontibacter sp. BT310]|uniref:Glutamate--tRNA ligase n=1 Tax=Pontibacter populi TaxID=890055 RepID=A0ABS6X8U7_9BACT|nr:MULTISPECIES: glutamate--tRNA ligase [Pontibacter]MBJ6117572.1 glutamate--tRNA ligase [Pontibacter sp. BT310]MBR0569997.1 glutamate--tRNA ligase [Microvirga sp. STS03]MBW3364425.1 glutamate--tRNA ligase [Pontibacter populi]